MPSRSRSRSRLAILVTCALALAPVAACSDDGDDPAPTTTAEAPGGDTTTTATGDPEPTTTSDPDDGASTTTTTTGDDPEPDGDDDEGAYVDALAQAFVAEDNTDLPLDQAQADCIAPRWIDAIGTDRLAEAGIAPADLVGENEAGDGFFELVDEVGDAETGAALAAAFGECDIDLTELVAAFLAAEGTATEAQVDCFVAAVPDGLLEASLAASLDGDDETVSEGDDELDAAVTSCLE